MSMKVIKGFVFAVVFTASGMGLVVTAQAVNAAQELQAKEGECIARLIALEVERRDIQASDGTCWQTGR